MLWNKLLVKIINLHYGVFCYREYVDLLQFML